MNRYQIWGVFLFGFALSGFAAAQFAAQHFLQGLLPFGDVPVYLLWVNVVALMFLMSGVLLMLRKGLRFATVTAGILFFIFFLYPHLSNLIADPFNGGRWTGTFECLSLSCGAFLTGIAIQAFGNRLPVWTGFLIRYMFGLCILVFGIQHFMYADYIATLIPAWLPFHLFWAYFVGVAFAATALSIFLNVLVRFSCTLLSIMFFTWVIILHAPRVAASPTVEPEWTSMFVALAMGAIALLASGLSIRFDAIEEEEHIKGKEWLIQV